MIQGGLTEPLLIVDDETGVVDLLKRFLKTEGFFAIEAAHTGAEAMEKMKSRLFNIVICDIRLPDMEGTELIRRLKEYNPLCNIIMITAFSSMDYVVDCLGGGASDYFTKPFRDMRELIDAVKATANRVERWKRNIPLVVR